MGNELLGTSSISVFAVDFTFEARGNSASSTGGVVDVLYPLSTSTVQSVRTRLNAHQLPDNSVDC